MTSRIAVAVALAASLAACGDGTGPGESGISAELAGTWSARPDCPECGFTLQSTSNPADSLNVVRSLGLTVTMQIERSGRFTLIAGGATTTGTARASGSVLVVTDGATADTIDYAVRGDLLDIEIRTIWHVLDFNGDGTADPATPSGTFRRQ